MAQPKISRFNTGGLIVAAKTNFLFIFELIEVYRVYALIEPQITESLTTEFFELAFLTACFISHLVQRKLMHGITIALKIYHLFSPGKLTLQSQPGNILCCNP
jgi:hypothetical protein